MMKTLVAEQVGKAPKAVQAMKALEALWVGKAPKVQVMEALEAAWVGEALKAVQAAKAP